MNPLPSARRLQNPLVSISILGATIAFFFIAKQVHALTFFKLATVDNTFFYGGFGLIGLCLSGILFFHKNYASRSLLDQFSLLSISLLPTFLIIFTGVILSPKFHFIFQVGSGLGLIMTASLFYYRFVKRQPKVSSGLSVRDWWRAQGAPTLFLVLFLSLTFFSFGFIRLGQYAAVDEPLWLYGRISQYWNNIADREFHKTDVSDKPGITVSILSGAALLKYDPDDYDDLRSDGEVFINRNLDMAQFFAAFRFPLLLFVTLLLPLLYFFLERALGRGAALLSFALLATSPLLIGVTKIINPDALLWIFTTLSIVSYLVFQKRTYYRYLFLSGLFLGLALLTKYIANIVFIYLLLLLFVEYLYHPRLARQEFSSYLRKSLLQIGFVIFVSLATFYIILPANWVDPMELIQGTILSQAFVKVAPLFLGLIFLILLDENLNQSRIIAWALKWLGHFRLTVARLPLLIFFASILFVLITTWSHMAVYDFMQLIASPKTISSKSDLFGVFVTNFYPLTFGMTPLALLGILIAALFLSQKHFWKSSSLRFAFYITLLSLVYYLGATVNGVASIIRYQIIIFPLVALLGGIGLFHLARFVERKYHWQKDHAVFILTLIVLACGVATLARTHFPLSYASSLLPSQYYIDLKDMGPGSYEIAQKLNSLPNAKDTLIWTDKDGVCQFFVGRCKRGNNPEVITDQDIDYIVISSARKIRTGHMIRSSYDSHKDTVIPIHLFYDKENPDFEVKINERPSHYVRAFRYEGRPQ